MTEELLSKKKKRTLKKLKRSSPVKKKTINHGQLGRPRICVSYEEAKEVVKKENLQSRDQYIQWWMDNRPARLPKRPDRAYKKEWTKWGDFLGIWNIFPHIPQKFRSFEDARNFARSLRLSTQTDWQEYCRSGKRPKDIPARPDFAYGRSAKGKRKLMRGGQWYSWRDWLGSTSLTDQIEAIRKQSTVLIITQTKEYPNNVYLFKVFRGFDEDIKNKIKEDNIYVLRAYIFDSAYDWGNKLSIVFQKFYDINGAFIIPNINEVYYNFDMNMHRYNL